MALKVTSRKKFPEICAPAGLSRRDLDRVLTAIGGQGDLDHGDPILLGQHLGVDRVVVLVEDADPGEQAPGVERLDRDGHRLRLSLRDVGRLDLEELLGLRRGDALNRLVVRLRGTSDGGLQARRLVDRGVGLAGDAHRLAEPRGRLDEAPGRAIRRRRRERHRGLVRPEVGRAEQRVVDPHEIVRIGQDDADVNALRRGGRARGGGRPDHHVQGVIDGHLRAGQADSPILDIDGEPVGHRRGRLEAVHVHLVALPDLVGDGQGRGTGVVPGLVDALRAGRRVPLARQGQRGRHGQVVRAHGEHVTGGALDLDRVVLPLEQPAEVDRDSRRRAGWRRRPWPRRCRGGRAPSPSGSAG